MDKLILEIGVGETGRCAGQHQTNTWTRLRYWTKNRQSEIGTFLLRNTVIKWYSYVFFSQKYRQKFKGVDAWFYLVYNYNHYFGKTTLKFIFSIQHQYCFSAGHIMTRNTQTIVLWTLKYLISWLRKWDINNLLWHLSVHTIVTSRKQHAISKCIVRINTCK